MTGIDDWSGKTVLVVGGGGGMGRATAHEFESAGANIVIADINTKNLPPQYFTRLRLETNQVVLVFRWPEPGKTIQLSDVRNVVVVEAEIDRRLIRRVSIESAGVTYRSYGFSALDYADSDVLEALQHAVERTIKSQP